MDATIRFRRLDQVRLVRVAERAETWTPDPGSPMSVEPGDVIVSSGKRIWSITPESFAIIYVQVEGDAYKRTSKVWTQRVGPRERVVTQEGEGVAEEGQWRITDDNGNSRFVPKDVFTTNYRPVQPTSGSLCFLARSHENPWSLGLYAGPNRGPGSVVRRKNPVSVAPRPGGSLSPVPSGARWFRRH